MIIGEAQKEESAYKAIKWLGAVWREARMDSQKGAARAERLR
jgi:hypothetical protein